jgi:four helix bundle protein
MQDFRKLKVWQKAHELVLATYQATSRMPAEERFGLSSQIRRCAVSVASNIVEGSSRGSDADFARFVQIAIGSASELEYQLLLAHDLQFIDERSHRDLSNKVIEVRKMLITIGSRMRAPKPSSAQLTARGS